MVNHSVILNKYDHSNIVLILSVDENINKSGFDWLTLSAKVCIKDRLRRPFFAFDSTRLQFFKSASDCSGVVLIVCILSFFESVR